MVLSFVVYLRRSTHKLFRALRIVSKANGMRAESDNRFAKLSTLATAAEWQPKAYSSSYNEYGLPTKVTFPWRIKIFWCCCSTIIITLNYPRIQGKHYCVVSKTVMWWTKVYKVIADEWWYDKIQVLSDEEIGCIPSLLLDIRSV